MPERRTFRHLQYFVLSLRCWRVSLYDEVEIDYQQDDDDRNGGKKGEEQVRIELAVSRLFGRPLEVAHLRLMVMVVVVTTMFFITVCMASLLRCFAINRICHL